MRLCCNYSVISLLLTSNCSPVKVGSSIDCPKSSSLVSSWTPTAVFQSSAGARIISALADFSPVIVGREMHNQREAGNMEEQREAARLARVISFARDLDTIQIHLIVKALFYFILENNTKTEIYNLMKPLSVVQNPCTPKHQAAESCPCQVFCQQLSL